MKPDLLTQREASCGVARQYTCSAGKIANCQIGVFACYVSRRGHAVINRALYLPKASASDPTRMKAARVAGRNGLRDRACSRPAHDRTGRSRFCALRLGCRLAFTALAMLKRRLRRARQRPWPCDQIQSQYQILGQGRVRRRNGRRYRTKLAVPTGWSGSSRAKGRRGRASVTGPNAAPANLDGTRWIAQAAPGIGRAAYLICRAIAVPTWAPARNLHRETGA